MCDLELHLFVFGFERMLFKMKSNGWKPKNKKVEKGKKHPS